MRRLAWSGAAAGLVLVAACQEKLTSPADCPALCPGSELTVFDTVVTAEAGRDTTFTGYAERAANSAIRVSSGLAASEDRGVLRFVPRNTQVTVDSQPLPYTVDSVALVVPLAARDTAVDDLRLLFYALDDDLDATVTFAEIEAQLTPERLIDSAVIADSTRSGAARTVLSGDELSRLPLSGTDSVLSVALVVRAGGATGVRLGGTGQPFQFITYARVAVADTAKQRQLLIRGPAFIDWRSSAPPAVDSTHLVVGGSPSSRALIRFALPPAVRDSATIVRATLVLTPTTPIQGLPNDPAVLVVRNLLADLGAKSPLDTRSAATPGAVSLEPGTADSVEVDVTTLVRIWQLEDEDPPAFFLYLLPDGNSFTNPSFYSSRAAAGQAPRLRIEYAFPNRFGSR